MKDENWRQHVDADTKRTYASTAVSGEGQAVLGDISQDVNISGDVHVHLHAPFQQAIAYAGSVTRFLHFCTQLRLSGKELCQPSDPRSFQAHLVEQDFSRASEPTIRTTEKPSLTILREEQLRRWIRLSNELGGVVVMLANEKGKLRTQYTGVAAQQALQELVVKALEDARELQFVTEPLTDKLQEYLLLSPATSTQDDQLENDDFIIEELRQPRTAEEELEVSHQSNEFMVQEELLEAVADARKKSQSVARRRNNWSNAHSTFLTYWKKHSLDQKLLKLLRYHDLLYLNLDAVLNAKHIGRTIQQPAALIDDSAGLAYLDSNNNDFVEVLSINKPVQKGLLNVATILTRQNGEKVTLQSNAATNSHANTYANTDLMRYDLREKLQAENHESGPLVQQTPDFVKMITAALYFREECERRIQVKEAHCTTFSWIFKESNNAAASQFPAWLRTGSQIFFVNGKPGSGKSTLMKYIHQHNHLEELLSYWSQSRQLIFATFFFWYSGKPLQKSYEGVLRSLLHQILTKRPDLTPRVFPQLSHYILSAPRAKLDDISISELQGAILLLARKMPDDLAIFLMIDGVDEYTGDHYEFAKFLAKLTDCKWIKVLVSSRPTSTSFQVFSRFPSIKVQDLTTDDIRAYIDAELVQTDLMQDRDCLEAGFADKVKHVLLEKSSGVFLWIVIVVKKLLLGLDASEDTHELMGIIDHLPTELDQLYNLIFGRMSKEHQRQGSLLLQLVGHAREIQVTPFAALQLLEAIKGYTNFGRNPEDLLYDPDKEHLRVKMVDGKLRNRCCGLVEVVYKSSDGSLEEPKVDFLHRTVYDYLRQEDVRELLNAMYELKPRETNLNLLASSAYMLKRRALFPLPSASKQACTKDYFSACLNYSEELDHMADIAFLKFLAVADASYIECCKEFSDVQAKELYTEAYQTYAMLRDYQQPRVADIIMQVADPHTYAVLLSAQLAPTPYFESKVKADPSTKSLMLLHLLELSRTCQSEDFAHRYLRNIKSLVRCGVDPDLSVVYAAPLNEEQDEDIFGSAGNLATGRSITPFNFWLASFVIDVWYLEIFLLLVKAGAYVCQAGMTRSKADCVERVRVRLQDYLGSVTDRSPDCHDKEAEENITCNERMQAKSEEEEAQRTPLSTAVMCRQILKCLDSADNLATNKRKDDSVGMDEMVNSKKHKASS